MMRILLQLDRAANRRLLAEGLGGSYGLVDGSVADSRGEKFDLCIFDVAALRNCPRLAEKRRRSGDGVLAPVLLIASRREVQALSDELWQGIDELLVTPFATRELQLRVAALLHARRLALELTRRDEEAKRENYALLRVICQGSHDAIFAKDLEGRYTLVNRACADFFGVPVAEALGKRDTDLFEPDSARKILEDDRRILASGQSETFDEVLQTARGPRRIYFTEKRPYADEQGRIRGILGIARDITERQRLEAQLRERENHLRTIVEAEPEWVKLLSEGGELLEVNPAGLAILEADSPAEVLGRPMHELVAEEYRPAFRDLLEGVFRGEPGTLEFDIVGLKGSRRRLETHAAPLCDSRGRVVALLGITRDITERQRTEESLREKTQYLQLALQAAHMGAWGWNIQTDTVWVAQGSGPISGLPAEFAPKTVGEFHQLVHPNDRAMVAERLRLAREEGQEYQAEFRIILPDGTLRHVLASGQCVCDAVGKSMLMIGVDLDITERKQAEIELRETKEHMHGILCSLRDAVWSISAINHRPLYLNPAAQKLYGRPVGDSFGYPSPWLEMAHPEDRERILECSRELFAGKPTEVEYRIVRPGGEVRWVRDRASLVRDAEGKPLRIDGITMDLTLRKLAEAALEHQANHDTLTGLPNRHLLYQRLAETLEFPPGSFAVMLGDLDSFKEINDTLGHHVGDDLLKQLAGRLAEMMTEDGLVARLGGDEFAVLTGALQDPKDAWELGHSLLKSINRPYDLSGLRLQISASLGIALYPDHGRDTGSLMRCADVAMYAAKKEARGVAFYTPEFDLHTPRRLVMMTELHQAIADNHLLLHYQPKVGLKDGRTLGFEALVRWRHPFHGMIPPDDFIPQAENTELIKPLTAWVLDQAAAQAERWRRSGPSPKIAVNLSTRNLLDASLPEQIDAVLAKHAIPPDHLELEITESAIMADPPRTLEVVKRLRAMGLNIAIDDFGTGYSSLAYLARLPVHSLKIDRSFVRSMLDDLKSAAIVQSTIGLAHTLGLEVIAEGVETPAVVDALRELGCDQAQGYLFSRPEEAERMTDWLTKTPA